MASQGFYSAKDAAENKDSFYNVIRTQGKVRCPFWDSLGKPIPFDGDPSEPHTWYFRPTATVGQTNKYAEGSKRAIITKWGTQQLSNRLQIFKKTSGMSKSQMAATTVENRKSNLNTQKLFNRKQMQLDIEKASISADAPTTSTDADGNRLDSMAGAAHYATLTIDAADTDVFSMEDHVIEVLKYMWENGVDEDKIIMCSPTIKGVINNYLQAGKQYNAHEKKVTTNVTHIEDSGWGTNIPIKVNQQLPAGDMMIYAPALIHPVPLRAEKDADCSDKTYDGVAYEDVIEQTLQVDDQNAIVYIKNIKTA